MLVIALTTGCGPDLSTPESSAKAFLEAAVAGDESALAEMMHGSEVQCDAMVQQTLVGSALFKLAEAIHEAYPEEAKKAKDARRISLDDFNLDGIEAKVDGDKARVKIPATRGDNDVEVDLINVDGDWMCDASAKVPEARASESAEQAKKLRTELEAITERVEDKAISFEEAQKQIAEAMLARFRRS